MKIGIIGSGVVARSFGKGLIGAGHSVMLGSRDPSKKELQEWLSQNSKQGQVGSVKETADYGELTILAVAGHAAAEVLTSVKTELAGKIVIDLTNPLVFGEDGSPGLSIGHTDSGGEIAQRAVPASLVVKTLNIINHEHMIQPKYEQGIPIMFLCGNNDQAKQQVTEFLKELGWQDIIDLGGIEKSRVLEPLCLLWVDYGVIKGTWDHAFAILQT